ncbi:MAG TPA: sulfite oxidase-like oxidoreductase [Longimicrobium sp.]|nr:sulfite oxidase-like oxidoreductase [Longimicrobium sp.]
MSTFRKRGTLPPEVAERLPPNQALTEKWPVLHYGSVPVIAPAQWALTIFGLVEEEVRIGWDDLQRLPRAERTNDIHCVTHWSRLGNAWTGAAVPDVLALARVRPEATHVMLHAFGNYTTNLSLEDFARPGNLFATHHDGAPLAPEHGGPVRVVVPHLYFWKSAKWVRGVELMAGDRPGFWEENGYHMRGDPWRSERYDDSPVRRMQQMRAASKREARKEDGSG